MEVHGQLVGVRLHPRDRADPGARPVRHRADAAARRAVDRAGAPRLRDRQRRLDRARGGHGPPRLHDQRDGAPARRTAASSTPSAASRDLERRELRTVAPTSFEDDPLRLVRAPALRLAARFRPRAGDARPDARRQRRGSRTSPPSGSAAGSRPTARASSRSSCSGSEPARALRARPRHRACSRASSPSSRRRSASRSSSDRQPLPLDEHLFAVVAERRRRRLPARGAARRPAPRPRQAARRGR